MASKQFGKLRQWAGEVISTREKTQPSSEFMALEREMEVRKSGLEKLHLASHDYLEYVSQKKQSDVVPGEPIAQSEALGVVMMGHGEELGDTSALGRSLATYGRARCRIATIQNIYAVTLTDTFLAYLERSRAKLDEYFAQRKKLESRRLAYDAAIAKADKTYKKEKDKKEAEEELARAKARYEEMAEDVTARMDAIRESEVEYQRELKNFLGSEIKFVEQYLDVLREVQLEWPEPDSYAELRRPTSSIATPHNFSRTSTRSTDSKDSDAKQAPPIPSRFGSNRSNRSVTSLSSKKSASARSSDRHELFSESEQDDDDVLKSRSQASSRLKRKKSSTRTSRAPSHVRSRSASVATIGNNTVGETGDDTTSIKSNGKHKKASSGGVTTWVGDAMSNVMGRNKSKNPDVENFSTLDDKYGIGSTPVRKPSNHSTKSSRSANGRSRSRTRESAKRTRKVVKAVYDFSAGSSDELSFKAGEEIVVVNEVLDDWWVGETGGRRGIFPANYTVFFKTVDIPAPGTRFKNSSATNILGLSRRQSMDEESRRTLVEPSESELSMTEDEHDASSVTDEWHPFDDAHENSVVPAKIILPSSDKDTDFADGPVRIDSFASEDEFNRKLSSSLAKLNVQEVPSLEVSASAVDAPSPSPGKRMPPPPPPRRQTTSGLPSGPPPLPVRNIAPSRTHSSVALQSLGPPVLDRRVYSETSSPFESQSELSFDTVANTKVTSAGTVACISCGCDNFVEDPFRGHGLCAHCTHAHA